MFLKSFRISIFFKKHPKLFCLYISNQISLRGYFVFKTNKRISSMTSNIDYCCGCCVSLDIKATMKLYFGNSKKHPTSGVRYAPILGSDFSIFVKKRTDSVYLGIRNKANWSQTLNWDSHECRASKNEVYWSIISNYKMAFPTQEQGRILAAKVPRILAGSLELSGEVLDKNHALSYQKDEIFQKYPAPVRNLG